MRSIKVLTVCLGNICRSPAAQGILESMSFSRKGLDLTLDSAGTAAYHIGSAPDLRSIQELKGRSIDISQQKARQVKQDDFEHFDWILAMDGSNYQNLLNIAPIHYQDKIVLFGQLPGRPELGSVKDPYYDDALFPRMADHLTELSVNFLDFLEEPQNK